MIKKENNRMNGADNFLLKGRKLAETAFNEDRGRILMAEDEVAVRESLKEFLELFGHDVELAENGAEALKLLAFTEYDLVITDLNMPVLDGFEVIRRGRRLQPETIFMVLSGQDSFENAQLAMREGAYNFVTKPIRDWDYFQLAVARALEHRKLLSAQKNYQLHLEAQVEAQTKELLTANTLLKQYTEQLEHSSIASIAALMSALEEKDSYTAGHSRRVTTYTKVMAEIIGLSTHECWICKTAAQLHDIGKITIDLSYVRKPGPLDEEEWLVMNQHPEIGSRILAPLLFLREVRPLIKHHHERLDGRGYPDGLAGNEISLLTQILAVADTFDAMTSRRAYRKPVTYDLALVELRSCIGHSWCKEPVTALAEYLNKTPLPNNL